MAQLGVELCFKPEGRGFDSRWCHWSLNLVEPSGSIQACTFYLKENTQYPLQQLRCEDYSVKSSMFRKLYETHKRTRWTKCSNLRQSNCYPLTDKQIAGGGGSNFRGRFARPPNDHWGQYTRRRNCRYRSLLQVGVQERNGSVERRVVIAREYNTFRFWKPKR